MTSDIKRRVCVLLFEGRVYNGSEIACLLNEDPEAISRVLIEMDDQGDLIMRNGWYRLSKLKINQMRDENANSERSK